LDYKELEFFEISLIPKGFIIPAFAGMMNPFGISDISKNSRAYYRLKELS